jgi:hydroxymethylglutaryl-CoA lyase
VIDSSVGGLGGCPYAKTKAGNVCTENVVWLLNTLGIEHDVDYEKLKTVGLDICSHFDKQQRLLENE